MTHPTVDAHQHFWQRKSAVLDYSWLESRGHEAINRDFLPQDLLPRIQSAGIERTVLVQTQHHLAENDWSLKLADQHDFIAGVVGWVDLASEDVEEQLLRYREHPKFVGVRHITQDEPDDNFILRDEVQRGLKVLEKHRCPFDLLFYCKHIHHANPVGHRLPNLPLVVDHLAKPRIRDGQIDPWRNHLVAAARCENMYCKLSGMITEANHNHWTPEDLKPYVETALEAFGVERCMFGSDWPVCELAGSYQQVYDALVAAIGPVSEDEREHLFGKTAARFYNLSLT